MTGSPRAGSAAVRLLAAACLALFAGRAVQHGFGSPPLRAFFWDQDLLESWVGRLLGMTWESWAAHPGLEAGLDGLAAALSCLYAACALAVLPSLLSEASRGSLSRVRAFLIAAGGVGLGALALLMAKERFWRIGELLEYASQWMAPALLLLLVLTRRDRLVSGLARAAVAATFAGHGLYAVGFHPVPGPFIDMIILHLRVSEDTARTLLFGMGALDFAVAAAMLMPIRPARPFLAYAAAWGALTALARFGAWFDPTADGFGAAAWIPEVLVRLPHALLPLVVLALAREGGARLPAGLRAAGSAAEGRRPRGGDAGAARPAGAGTAAGRSPVARP